MSSMSERLLGTLDAIQARDEVASEVLEKAVPKAGVDYDEQTGEWLGDKPQGYQPIPDVPTVENPVAKESKVPEFDNSDASTDYKRVRDTTYALQEATLFMIGQTAKLAVTTEAPRAFSVFRELVDTMRGLNKDLMDNQKTYKSVTQGEDPKEENTVEVTTTSDGTTTVSVGKKAQSSRDLLKTIEEARKRSEERAESRGKKASGEDEEVIDVNPEPAEEGTDRLIENKDEEDGVSEA